jgi:hypothetical protein
MGLLGSIGSVGSLLSDPGKIVKEVVDAVLPEKLDVVADLAGAFVDFKTGRPLQALQHLGQAFKDLPAALADDNGCGSPTTARGWRGTPAFEPGPPRRADGDELKWEKLFSMLESIQKAIAGNGGWVEAGKAKKAGETVGAAVKKPGEKDESEPASGTKSPSTKTSTKKTSSTKTTPKEGSKDTEKAGSTSTSKQTSKDPPSLAKLNKMSDADFMAALRSGNLPKEVTDDPSAMLAIQARMNHISEMTKLMTNMMQAMHDMQMSILQNVRV